MHISIPDKLADQSFYLISFGSSIAIRAVIAIRHFDTLALCLQ